VQNISAAADIHLSMRVTRFCSDNYAVTKLPQLLESIFSDVTVMSESATNRLQTWVRIRRKAVHPQRVEFNNLHHDRMQ